jgi:hypothetical protein
MPRFNQRIHRGVLALTRPAGLVRLDIEAPRVAAAPHDDVARAADHAGEHLAVAVWASTKRCEQMPSASCPRCRHPKSAFGTSRRVVAAHIRRQSEVKRTCHRHCPTDATLSGLSATVHSITSSARASSIGGTSSPWTFAALRLMTNSYLVGFCTGRSAGLAPLSMRST